MLLAVDWLALGVGKHNGVVDNAIPALNDFARKCSSRCPDLDSDFVNVIHANRHPRIFYWPSESVVRRLCVGIPQHHERMTSSAEQIITLLDHFAVFAVVEPEFFPPIQMFLEYFQFPSSHPVEHRHQFGLDALSHLQIGHVREAC